MNAVRLQSKGLGGSEDRTIRASYGSFSKNIGIRYQIDSFSTYSYSGLAPYTGFLKVCDSVAMILGPDKALKGLNFPWDSYSKLSPVRPLCVSVGGTPGVTYFAGDFQITPSSDKNVTASAWFKIAADLSLPEGFSLMQFSGSFSNMGDVRNIVSFEASGNFTLITPQINLDHFGGITYAAESLGALGYDKETGNMWYIPSSRTMNSPQMPYRFQMNLPKSCLLIFGSLSQNEVLPAKLGQEMTYLGSWGKKNYTFASFSSTAAAHKLNITIKSDQDSNFVVYENPTSVLEEEGITPVAYYQIGFTGSPILTLAYPNASQYIWA